MPYSLVYFYSHSICDVYKNVFLLGLNLSKSKFLIVIFASCFHGSFSTRNMIFQTLCPYCSVNLSSLSPQHIEATWQRDSSSRLLKLLELFPNPHESISLFFLIHSAFKSIFFWFQYLLVLFLLVIILFSHNSSTYYGKNLTSY